MSTRENWAHAVAQNLVANALWVVGAAAVGAFAIGLAAMTPAFRMFAPFSYLVAALSTAILIVGLIHLCVRLWRLLLPASSRATETAPELDHSPSVSWSGFAELRDELDGLKAQFAKVSEIVQGIMKSQGELNRSLSERLGAIISESEKNARLISEHKQDVERLHSEIKTGIDLLLGRLRESIEHRFTNVDQAFHALSNREWHERLFSELSTEFDVLAKPVHDGMGISDWPAWDRSAKSWRAKLDQWLVIANYYTVGASEKVLTIPEELYYGGWTIDEKALDNASQVHRYKELAIWWHNAKEIKGRVDRSIEQTAFVSPSKKGRLDPPPRMEP